MNKISMYIPLFDDLLKDCQRKCSTKVCSRDLNTIKSRIKHEGLSFVTITLPKFCDEIFTSLESGQIDSNAFPGWKKHRRLPAFLQDFVSLVFDLNTGRILDEQNTQAVRSIRQICFLFKKIKMPCTKSRNEKAINSFLRTDDELQFVNPNIDILTRFNSIARVLSTTLVPFEVLEDQLIPHHGPGATSEKVSGNRKYITTNFKWYNQLKGFSEELTTYSSEESYKADQVDNKTDNEPVVRVVSVPKTQKSPRIIALEPVVMQMTQQSIKDFLVERIEKCRLTSGHVNFHDQKINQYLALSSSKNKKLATIDLSEASDRVCNKFVKMLFESNPSFGDLVQSTRSPMANVDGKLINLNKFASMGSALCFPVESLMFFTLLILAKTLHMDPPYTLLDLYKLSRDIYVYGDDIIIPVELVDSAITIFEMFGLKVNTTKSFVYSSFRESCGMDAYSGECVTPVYIRQPFHGRKVASHIVSLVETSRAFYKTGYYRVSHRIQLYVEKLLGCTLPNTTDTCEGLGWVDCNNEIKTRYNRNLQRLEVLTFVPKVVFKKDNISGDPALLKCLIRLTRTQRDNYADKVDSLYQESLSNDNKHLSRTPVRGALTLTRRWVSNY